RCCQCEEIFCSKCAARMHRSGRMRDHQLVPIPQDKAPAIVSSPQRLEPSTSMTCRKHAGEPLQFFCQTCVECICTECVIPRGAAHHGHDVVNVRVAFQQLSHSMKQALETAATRLQGSPARKQTELLPLENGFSKVKIDLVNAFEIL
ncbi:Txnl4a, partial [Symbiodinium pilosum]